MTKSTYYVQTPRDLLDGHSKKQFVALVANVTELDGG